MCGSGLEIISGPEVGFWEVALAIGGRFIGPMWK
jgi:hypothetical protein